MQKVINFLRKNYKGKKYLLGFSGGVDSAVLFDLLLKAQIDFVAVHINHNLRKEAKEDADFVKNICTENKINCVIVKADVDKFSKKWKMGLEEVGRRVRRNVFEQTLEEKKLAGVFLAHHADDQVETILLNLLRGCGRAGLCGMRKENQKYLRPLLSVFRTDILNYAKKNKLEWKEDKTNKSLVYKRNKIRHVLLPALFQKNSNIKKEILLLAKKSQKETDDLEKFAKKFTEKNQFERSSFLKLDVEKRGFVVRQLWKNLHGSVQGFERQRFLEVNRLIQRNIGNKQVPFGNFWITLNQGVVRLVPRCK